MPPTSRLTFITHKGKQIMFLDLAGLVELSEAYAAIEEAKKAGRIHPPNTMLTLTDVTNARFDSTLTAALRELAVANKPYVKAAAIVGLSPIMRIIHVAVQRFAGRTLPAFDDLESAKEWLVGVGGGS